MTWIMVAVLVVTVATAFRPGFDLLSPSRIYISVYALLLSFYYLELSKLQTPWSSTTNFLFYGASGMFLAGCAWMWILGRTKRPEWKLDFRRMRDDLKRDAATVDWAWYRKVFAVSVLIFLASFLVSWAVIGNLPAFMPNPDKARMKFFSATQLSNYGIFMGPISLMLGVVLLWFSSPTRGQRRAILATQILVLALYMTIVTRYDLFRFILFTVILYHYGRNRLRPIHVIAAILLTGTIFFAGFFVRVNTDSIGAFNEMIKVKMPKHLAWASSIYAYLANDFWNMDFAVKKYIDGDFTYPLQYGVSLFRALLWNLRLEPELVQAYHFDTMFNESATKVKGLNTVIYVWHFYKDFGIPGVMLLPLGAGVFSWIQYQNTLFKPSILRVSLWAILAGGIGLSYHGPLWEFWFFYLNIMVILIAHRGLRAA
jgi:oligosaccharide repeat unit polymerase